MAKSEREPNSRPPNAARKDPQGDGDTCYFCEPALGFIREFLDLTEKETEICHCVVLGDDDRSIAALLGMRVGTLRTHLRKMYAKLQVRSRSALLREVFWAHEHWICVGEPPVGCMHYSVLD